jgi:hypothetical protein
MHFLKRFPDVLGKGRSAVLAAARDAAYSLGESEQSVDMKCWYGKSFYVR